MADDLSLQQLAREAGVTVRTIRYYLERHVLPSPPFKSRNTRYGKHYVPLLHAITKLRAARMSVEAIRKKLAGATEEEILVLAGLAPPAEAAPAAAAMAAHPPVPADFVGPYRPALARASERWEHVAICPGVVLMVRGEADAEAWRVAREITAMFGGGA